jgi:hypothetical protein
MNRVRAAALAVLLLAGCAAPGDWRFSDVNAAIDAFRKERAGNGEQLPRKVRSIYVDGPDSLRVYLSDEAGFRGRGYELKLKRLPSGSWSVVGSRAFD